MNRGSCNHLVHQVHNVLEVFGPRNTQALAASGAFTALAVLTSTLAMAQSTATNGTAAETEGLQEVIVTARYAQENLQKTPIAITTLDSAVLKSANIGNLTDLGALVPNLFTYPSDDKDGGATYIILRGVGETVSSYAVEPAIGLYIDDVYHPTNVGKSVNLNDIDRIEVERGPQGTLEGNASMGGAIHLYTKEAMGDNSGFLEATYGSFNKVQLDGAFDTTIAPNLFMRVSGSVEHQDGYVDLLDFACEMNALGTPQLAGSLTPSQPGSSQRGCVTGHEGGTSDSSVRLKLRYKPRDDLELKYAISYSKNDDQGSPEVMLRAAVPAGDSLFAALDAEIVKLFGISYDSRFLPPPGHPYSSYSTWCRPSFGNDLPGIGSLSTTPSNFCLPNANLMDSFTQSFNVNYDISSKVHLTGIFAFKKYSDTVSSDVVQGPQGYQLFHIDQPVTERTAEVRLNGTLFDDRFKWVAGGYYLHYKAESNGFVAYYTDSILETDTALKDSESGFLHGEYKLTDAWSVSGGLRYSYNKLTYDLNHPGILVFPEPYTVSQDRVDWLAATNYQLTKDTMAYVSVATGSRPGGITTIIATPKQVQPIAAEELTSYELGVKSEFFDHRVRLNTDIFYSDYAARVASQSGYQCLGQPGATATWVPSAAGCSVYANPAAVGWVLHPARPAVVQGFEFDLTANPVNNLLVNVSGGYNNDKSAVTTPGAPGYVAPGNLVQPRWNLSGGIQYAVPFLGGTLTPRLDWRFQTLQTFAANTQSPPLARNTIPAYSIFNAQMSYANNDKWSVILGVTNLSNKLYYYYLADISVVTSSNVAPPREFTVRLRRDF